MRSQGFTLIEVLIAMACTALVAAAAYTSLSAVISGTEQLRESGDRLREVNRTFNLLSRDLQQFVRRPIIDEFGDLQPALSGGPLANYPLSLTRGGWHNSQQLPRSDLQRVQYFLDEGSLYRGYFPVLDRSTSVNRQDVVLLENVDRFELRFLEAIDVLELDRSLAVDTRNWIPNWVSAPGAPLVIEPPVAIEIRLELSDMGELRRIYEIPGR